MLLIEVLRSVTNMDINCDLGEGIPGEEKLMALIDSCNIACGGHFGDNATMSSSLKLSKKMGVRPGAHPSFVDRVHFGRKVVKVSLHELKEQMAEMQKKIDAMGKK